MDHLTALKVFRAVAANGGFAAAARQMNLSPAAVSKNVAELEAHLKVRLINRTTRNMSLTEAGEVYRQRLERILDDLEAADAALTSMQQGPSGLLRVNAPLTLALTCLTPAIPAFLQRYPDLRLELLLQDGRQDLIAEGIDLALRGSDRVADSGLVARPLLVLEHVLCAAPAYLGQHGQPLRPEALREHECIRFSLWPCRPLDLPQGPRVHSGAYRRALPGVLQPGGARCPARRLRLESDPTAVRTGGTGRRPPG